MAERDAASSDVFLSVQTGHDEPRKCKLLPGKTFKIGRHKTNDFQIKDLKAVSSFHTEIVLSTSGASSSVGPVCYVRDLSSNGTGVSKDEKNWTRASQKPDTTRLDSGMYLLIPFKLKSESQSNETDSRMRLSVKLCNGQGDEFRPPLSSSSSSSSDSDDEKVQEDKGDEEEGEGQGSKSESSDCSLSSHSASKAKRKEKKSERKNGKRKASRSRSRGKKKKRRDKSKRSPSRKHGSSSSERSGGKRKNNSKKRHHSKHRSRSRYKRDKKKKGSKSRKDATRAGSKPRPPASKVDQDIDKGDAALPDSNPAVTNAAGLSKPSHSETPSASSASKAAESTLVEVEAKIKAAEKVVQLMAESVLLMKQTSRNSPSMDKLVSNAESASKEASARVENITSFLAENIHILKTSKLADELKAMQERIWKVTADVKGFENEVAKQRSEVVLKNAANTKRATDAAQAALQSIHHLQAEDTTGRVSFQIGAKSKGDVKGDGAQSNGASTQATPAPPAPPESLMVLKAALLKAAEAKKVKEDASCVKRTPAPPPASLAALAEALRAKASAQLRPPDLTVPVVTPAIESPIAPSSFSAASSSSSGTVPLQGKIDPLDPQQVLDPLQMLADACEANLASTAPALGLPHPAPPLADVTPGDAAALASLDVSFGGTAFPIAGPNSMIPSSMSGAMLAAGAAVMPPPSFIAPPGGSPHIAPPPAKPNGVWLSSNVDPQAPGTNMNGTAAPTSKTSTSASMGIPGVAAKSPQGDQSIPAVTSKADSKAGTLMGSASKSGGSIPPTTAQKNFKASGLGPLAAAKLAELGLSQVGPTK